MFARFLKLPLVVILMGLAALAMLGPAVFAAVMRDWDSARVFLFSGLFLFTLTAMVALATANRGRFLGPRAPLFDIVVAFVFLPLCLAVPVWEAVPGLSFRDSYVEMVSSLTTTGATVLDLSPVPDAVHLWRATVGWLGGLLMWVIALAILAPQNLGGFEVISDAGAASSTNQISRAADVPARLRYYGARFAPIYAGLTLLLWLGLFLFGDRPLVALCHAMSTLATSGISPTDGSVGAASGFGGELLILVFFFFALSRHTFTRDNSGFQGRQLWHDPELRMGLMLALAAPMLLFLRHWVGALETEAEEGFAAGIQALWGGAFTVVSFLTTTGFQSASWQVAQDWSGLQTPGLIFLGLALVGGGVATTAGGVKLMRVHVLYRHGQRELDRLVHPSSVGSTGEDSRRLRRQGAFMAWIFFMLFAVSIAAVMLALSLTGLGFEASVIFTISALSTTGPLVEIAGEPGLSYSTLAESAKLILAASMILGRLETLAIISLFNPEIWRR